jgi:hypothetical protein
VEDFQMDSIKPNYMILREGQRLRFAITLAALGDLLGEGFKADDKRDFSVSCDNGSSVAVENLNLDDGIAGELVARQPGYAAVTCTVYRPDAGKFEAVFGQQLFVQSADDAEVVAAWLPSQIVQPAAAVLGATSDAARAALDKTDLTEDQKDAVLRDMADKVVSADAEAKANATTAEAAPAADTSTPRTTSPTTAPATSDATNATNAPAKAAGTDKPTISGDKK